jgi:hypothetical protein
VPVNISDVDTFTDPVTAPDDGDEANGATFQASPQALSNRTRNLKNRVDKLYGGAPVVLIGTLTLNDADVAIEQALTVGGNASVGADLAVTDDITCDDITVTDACSVGGTVSCQRVSASVDVFATRYRMFTGVGPDADTTLTVGSTAQVLVATTLTSNRDYTISDSGAVNGDFFWVVNKDAAQALTVLSPTAVGLGVLNTDQGGLFMRVGGTWYQITTTT